MTAPLAPITRAVLPAPPGRTGYPGCAANPCADPALYWIVFRAAGRPVRSRRCLYHAHGYAERHRLPFPISTPHPGGAWLAPQIGVPPMSDDLTLGQELFDVMAGTIARQQARLRGLDPVLHRSDADCEPFLTDDTCTVCGVLHGEPCPGCGGRGFHRATCVDQAAADTGRA